MPTMAALRMSASMAIGKVGAEKSQQTASKQYPYVFGVRADSRRAREYYLKGITKRICCHMLVRPFSDSSAHVAYRIAQGRKY